MIIELVLRSTKCFFLTWILKLDQTVTFVLFKMNRVKFFGNSVAVGISVSSDESQMKSRLEPTVVWFRQSLDALTKLLVAETCFEMSSSRNVGWKYSSLKIHWRLALGGVLKQSDDWPNDSSKFNTKTNNIKIIFGIFFVSSLIRRDLRCVLS